MKKSFIVYTDYAEKFKSLSDAQFGRLIRCMIDYEISGEVVRSKDVAVNLAFDVAKADLDRNKEKYADIIEKRRVAGKKGGLAKAGKSKQMLANANFAKQTVANVAVNVNDNVNDNDNVNVNVNDNDKKIIEERKEVKEIVELYNSVCISLPKVQKMTPKRRKALNARLKTYTVGDFAMAFEKVQASDFLTGKNDRNWMADFDFVINENKLQSILEGKYDNKRPQSLAEKWGL